MRRLETFIILLAIGFYVWFLSRFGFSDIAHYLRYAGWGLVFTVSLEAVARLANTAQRFVNLNQSDAILWPVSEAAVAGLSVEEIDVGGFPE